MSYLSYSDENPEIEKNLKNVHYAYEKYGLSFKEQNDMLQKLRDRESLSAQAALHEYRGDTKTVGAKGRKKGKRKNKKNITPWLKLVDKVYSENPELTYKESLIVAKNIKKNIESKGGRIEEIVGGFSLSDAWNKTKEIGKKVLPFALATIPAVMGVQIYSGVKSGLHNAEVNRAVDSIKSRATLRNPKYE